MLVRTDTSGSGLSELRLRRDFIHAPVPFFGGTRHHDLLRIALSDKMAGYRIGGSYDRPVLRRIAEQAGVPREAFGQRKRAINFLLNSQERKLAPATRRAVNVMIRDRLGPWCGVIEKLREFPRVAAAALWRFGLTRPTSAGFRSPI